MKFFFFIDTQLNSNEYMYIRNDTIRRHSPPGAATYKRMT